MHSAKQIISNVTVTAGIICLGERENKSRILFQTVPTEEGGRSAWFQATPSLLEHDNVKDDNAICWVARHSSKYKNMALWITGVCMYKSEQIYCSCSFNQLIGTITQCTEPE